MILFAAAEAGFLYRENQLVVFCAVFHVSLSGLSYLVMLTPIKTDMGRVSVILLMSQCEARSLIQSRVAPGNLQPL